MNKTAIYSTIIASTIAILAIFAFSSNEVNAIKPPTEETVEKIPISEGLDFGLVSISNGRIGSGISGAHLFYGATLCEFEALHTERGILIVFGGDTTVLHETVCVTNTSGELISLVGGTDVSFKKGDVLVLARSGSFNVEIFRDTT